MVPFWQQFLRMGRMPTPLLLRHAGTTAHPPPTLNSSFLFLLLSSSYPLVLLLSVCLFPCLPLCRTDLTVPPPPLTHGCCLCNLLLATVATTPVSLTLPGPLTHFSHCASLFRLQPGLRLLRPLYLDSKVTTRRGEVKAASNGKLFCHWLYWLRLLPHLVLLVWKQGGQELHPLMST